MYLQLITEDEEWANFSDDGNEDEEDGEGPEEEDDDGKIQTKCGLIHLEIFGFLRNYCNMLKVWARKNSEVLVRSYP